MTASPWPELLRSRRDLPGSSPWQVERGPALRGEAWTDLVGHEMRVPFDGTAHGRLVRAHELMHARVSPAVPDAFGALLDVHPRSVECAEECRVNQLLSRVGFGLDELRDGSERLTGSRLAEVADWSELAWFCGALAGTKALRELLGGVRRRAPEWVAPLKELERDLLTHLRRVPTAELASTAVAQSGLPCGFDTHTRVLARLIDRTASSRGHVAGAAGRRGARPAATGRFAPLVLDRGVALDRAIRGGRAPRRAAAAIGRGVTRPHRLVTDPSRRVFDRRRRGGGGVVVVDQSGSMALREEELAMLLATAPGAFVLGYSHAPGSTDVPNAWVLADRGRAATSVRPGNVGNGVDGPALRLAISRRRGTEPVVWLCDGQVTDSGDHADAALAEECAGLVLRHRIAMVATVPEAVDALSAGGRGLGRPRALGRVGAAVTASP